MSKRRKAITPVSAIGAPPKTGIKHSTIVKSHATQAQDHYQFAAYEPAPGVLPKNITKESAMAMDASPYDYLNQSMFSQSFVQYHFPGYPILAVYSQFPEYRKMSETIAKEMTRKWIKLTSKSDDDKSDKLALLEDALIRFKVQERFRKAAELDGLFGRGQLFVDVKVSTGKNAQDVDDELEKPLALDSTKIRKGSLVGFNIIEPIWTYPGQYNSDNPLAADFYCPQVWYVMGSSVHASRLIMFRSREVPDLLKAAYNFGGLSMSQLARPYVENWIRTRDSISDLVHSFSISGIKTDMSSVLGGGDDAQFYARADLFNNLRDNRGLMLMDKDAEEFFQFNTPLSGLDKLQAQAQEQMASVSNIPLVKLLGITPSGLNASSDGEIRVFYDYIHSMQVAMFTENLRTVLNIIMLSEFGEIDKDIGFIFEPLWALDDTEKANIRKVDADTDAVLVGIGSIAPEESRERVASDPSSGYNNIDVDMEIDDPLDEQEEKTNE